MKRITEELNWAGKNKPAQNGITLIALVVTIIVLIILAGVTINLVLGDNGIIEKAKESREKQEVAQITDKLELAKAPVAVDNYNIVKIEDYLAYIQGEGKIDNELTEIERVDEDNCYITIDGKYEFLLEHEENGNLKITYQGKIKELLPRIINIQLSNTTNSITAKIEAKRANKYNFYIKDNIDGEYELIEEDNETGEYIYSGLTQNTTYYIKLEAINKNGSVSSEITRSTSTMVELVEAEIEATIVPNTWTNGNVTTKIKLNTEKDVKDYTIQYAQSEQALTTEELKNVKWTNYTEAGILSIQNGIIYTRLYDGTNATSYMSREITIIDKTKPVINNLTATTNSITISAADEVSGIVGYVVSTSSTEPTTFVECDNTKTFNKTEEGLTQNTTYYVWVKDKAGNVSLVSNIKTEPMIDASVTEGAITFSAATWDASTHKASVTLSTNTSYTIKYQVNSYSGSWIEGTSVTGLNLNDTVYACLSDGTNNGNHTSLKITEKTAPSVTLVKAQEPTTNTISVTASASDAQSGMPSSPRYTFYLKKTSEADTAYVQKQSGTSATYTAGSLKQNTSYTIKVETKDNAGNTGSKTLAVTTSSISGTVTFGTVTWSSGKASVTLSTTSGYTIQYKIDSGSWTTGTSVTGISTGSTIYTRLSDGTNTLETASKNIVEVEPPTITLGDATGTGTSTTCSFTAEIAVTLADSDSGVNTTNSKYVWNTSSTALGTTSTSWDSATSIGATSKTITKSITSTGTWYLHILAVDNAGNKSESISKAVAVVANTHTHTSSCYHKHSGSSSSGGGCYTVKKTSTSKCTSTSFRSWATGYGDTYIFVCNYCGAQFNGCNKWGPGTCNSTKTTTYYELGCGKNTTTPYCGKTTDTAESYTMSYN